MAPRSWSPARCCSLAKDVVNHTSGVRDEFREKGLGYRLGAVMLPLHLARVIVLGIGALT